jgi:hypothetical protein
MTRSWMFTQTFHLGLLPNKSNKKSNWTTLSRTLKLHIKHLEIILPIHTYWDLNPPQALEIENLFYCNFKKKKIIHCWKYRAPRKWSHSENIELNGMKMSKRSQILS